MRFPLESVARSISTRQWIISWRTSGSPLNWHLISCTCIAFVLTSSVWCVFGFIAFNELALKILYRLSFCLKIKVHIFTHQIKDNMIAALLIIQLEMTYLYLVCYCFYSYNLSHVWWTLHSKKYMKPTELILIWCYDMLNFNPLLRCDLYLTFLKGLSICTQCYTLYISFVIFY